MQQNNRNKEKKQNRKQRWGLGGGPSSSSGDPADLTPQPHVANSGRIKGSQKFLQDSDISEAWQPVVVGKVLPPPPDWSSGNDLDRVLSSGGFKKVTRSDLN